MLVHYKGQKPNGCPVKVPVGLKSHGAMKTCKTVWLRPTAELPDADAIKLCALDPKNFEIVEANHPSAAAQPEIEPAPAAEGLELDPDRQPPKPKRGRRSKAQIAALNRAKEANG